MKRTIRKFERLFEKCTSISIVSSPTNQRSSRERREVKQESGGAIGLDVYRFGNRCGYLPGTDAFNATKASATDSKHGADASGE